MNKLFLLLISLITCNLALAHGEEVFIGFLAITILIHIVIVFLDYKFNGKSIEASILLFLLYFAGLYSFISMMDNKLFTNLDEIGFLLLSSICFFLIPFCLKIVIVKLHRLIKHKKI